MIYPQKIKSKKIDKFFKIFNLSVIGVSLILLLINYLATPNSYWSHLCIIGFIYIYCTVRYSITKRTNIANHVMIQTLLLAVLAYFVDYRLGFQGWSITLAVPILIIIANIAMFVITIISYKHYGKYAASQLIIALFSVSIIYFVYKGYVEPSALINVSIIISIINVAVSLVLCRRDLQEEIVKRFSF